MQPQSAQGSAGRSHIVGPTSHDAGSAQGQDITSSLQTETVGFPTRGKNLAGPPSHLEKGPLEGHCNPAHVPVPPDLAAGERGRLQGGEASFGKGL